MRSARRSVTPRCVRALLRGTKEVHSRRENASSQTKRNLRWFNGKIRTPVRRDARRSRFFWTGGGGEQWRSGGPTKGVVARLFLTPALTLLYDINAPTARARPYEKLGKLFVCCQGYDIQGVEAEAELATILKNVFLVFHLNFKWAFKLLFWSFLELRNKESFLNLSCIDILITCILRLFSPGTYTVNFFRQNSVGKLK